MLAALDNGIVFKKAFTDPLVFTTFVQDILGIDFQTSQIETEKRFFPKVGNIDFAYDIFAESEDHRIVVELQKVEYDYNFDRFLHYFLMAISELQRKATEYKIGQQVYTIILLTSPYTIQEKSGLPIKNEVMISSLDPQTLKGESIPLFGHQLIFLNPNYRDSKTTPQNYLDWLDLIYESIHSPEDYHLNLNNPGISQAIQVIDYDKLSPVEIRKMKEEEGKKATLKIYQNIALSEGKKLQEATQEIQEKDQKIQEKDQKIQAVEQKIQEAKQNLQEKDQKIQAVEQKAVEREKALLEALKKAGIDPDQI